MAKTAKKLQKKADGGPFDGELQEDPTKPKKKFIPPANATKVDKPDEGFNLLGEHGNKTYYDKQISEAKPGAITSDPDKYHDFLVSQLQSGVSPDQLISKKYMDASLAPKYNEFYKPVYTEKTQIAPPVVNPIPLKTENLFMRKDMTAEANLGKNSPYKVYHYPDATGGMSQATVRLHNPTTNEWFDQGLKPIDPNSFNPLGTEKPKYRDETNRTPTTTTNTQSGGFAKGGKVGIKGAIGKMKGYEGGGWIDKNGQHLSDSQLGGHTPDELIAMGYTHTTTPPLQQQQGQVINPQTSQASNLMQSTQSGSINQTSAGQPDNIGKGLAIGNGIKNMLGNSGSNTSGTGGGLAGTIGEASSIYGAAKAGQGAIRQALPKDKYGNVQGGGAQVINELTGSPVENIMSDVKNKKYLTAAAEVSMLPTLGRGIIDVIGKGNEKTGFWGKANSALNNNQEGNAQNSQRGKDAALSSQQEAAANQQNPNYKPTNYNNAYNVDPTQQESFGGGAKDNFNEALGGIKKFFAKGGMVKGGQIEGAGTGKSDSIKAKIAPDSFVVPVENSGIARQIRKNVLGDKPTESATLNQGGGKGVKLSNGEHLFTPEETLHLMRVGIDINELAPEAANQYKWHFKNGGLTAEKAAIMLHEGTANGHKITDKQRRYFGWKSNKGKADGGYIAQSFADGGPVKDDEDYNRYMARVVSEGDKPDTYEKYLAKNIGNSGVPYSKSNRTKAPKKGIQGAVNPLGYNNAPEVMNSIEPNLQTSNKDGLQLKPQYQPNDEDKKTLLQNRYGLSPDNADKVVKGQPIENKKTQKEMPDLGGVIGLAQAVGGAAYLQKQGSRPQYQPSPEFQNQLQRTIASSQYGYTPQQNALLNQEAIENRNLGNAQIASASGGNGAVALNNMRANLTDYNRNRLENASNDEQLRMQKMGMANNASLQNEGIRRQMFQDRLNSFMQNQQAGAGLLSSGISNVIGSQRYNQAKLAQDQIDKLYNI